VASADPTPTGRAPWDDDETPTADLLVELFASREFFRFLLVSGLLLRLLWMALVPYEPDYDGRWYVETARTMATGAGYREWGRPDAPPTAYFPVGYPAFLAALYVVLPATALTAKLANLALTAATWVGMRALVDRTFADPVAGNLTLVPLVLFPTQLAIVGLPYSETLTVALMIATVAACGSLDRSWRRALLTGTLLAALLYVRTQAALLVAFLGTLRCLAPRAPRRRILARLVAAHALALALVAPWALRNHEKVGRAVLTTNAGLNLLIGNNPAATGGFMTLQHMAQAGYDVAPRLPGGQLPTDDQTSGAVDDILGKIALEHIREDPWLAVRRIPLRLYRMLADDEHVLAINRRTSSARGRSFLNALMPLGNVYYWSFCGLSVAAIMVLAGLQLRRRAPRIAAAWVPLAVCTYWLLVHMPFFGWGRFHLPMMIWLAVYPAAVGAWFLRRQSPNRATGA
jgi:hypothetical protein